MTMQKGRSTITGSKFLVVAYFFLSNDFPVIFQVFINIYVYAIRMIHFYDHRMGDLVKLYHL